MAFREPHELHKRRWSRNLGLGVVLAVFVSLVFGLTIVKVTNDPLRLDRGQLVPASALEKGEGN